MQLFFRKILALIYLSLLLAFIACTSEYDAFLHEKINEKPVSVLFNVSKLNSENVKTKSKKNTYTTNFIQDNYKFDISVEESNWEELEEQNPSTKTNWGNTGFSTTWVPNDAIGIYMRRTDGVSDVFIDRSNVKYTTSSTTGTGTFLPSIFPGLLYPRNSNTKVNFWAYYPYAQFGGPDTSLVQFSLPTDMNNLTLNYVIPTNQTGTLLESADLMYATKITSKDKNSPAVDFTFNHALTLVTLAIKSAAFSGIVLTKAGLRGSKVTNSGTLLLDAPYTLSPNTINTFSPYAIINKKLNSTTPVYEDLIINPCTVTTINQRAQMELVLTIGNIDYTCPMPALNYNAKSRYTVTVTVNNVQGGNVRIAVGGGGSVQIGETILQGRDTASFSNVVDLNTILTANSGWVPFRATYDSNSPIDLLPVTPQSYTISQNSITSLLTLLFRPTSWYPTNGLEIHYDGFFSGGFAFTNSNVNTNTTWYDLSGYKRNAILKSINYSASSGWGVKSLNFDGSNDRADYPGVISPNYTMNFVLTIAPENQSANARINGTGTAYHNFYIDGAYGVTTRYVGVNSATYSGIIKSGSQTGYVPPRNQIIQLTMTYDSSTQVLKLYANGVYAAEVGGISAPKAIATASLAGASSGSRQLKSNFYSYMLYSRILSDIEILNLYTFNRTRFGML